MDFYRIQVRTTREKETVVYPEFQVRGNIEDLMIRGGSFYAVWDAEAGLWSRDEYDVQRMVDEDIEAKVAEISERADTPVIPKLMSVYGSKSWKQYKEFTRSLPDTFTPLDTKLTWLNSEVDKSDYVSKRLPYLLEEGDISAWDELVGTLYAPEERMKIEWAIGAVVSGDSKMIQKFLVFYGSAGTGKSTILNIVGDLFKGYTTSFDGKALGSSSNGAFSTEPFKEYPLVAIQHDGDLSKIDDNTRLNSIIAHEEMSLNEKYKSSYTARIEAMLFMGTNQPVRITDAKSGIIRRLIDVHPTGQTLTPKKYEKLMSRIKFELGAIAWHCLQVYEAEGKTKYNAYRPIEMIVQTDPFFNFVESYFDVFKTQEYTTMQQAWRLYKEWCEETGTRQMQMHRFRTELANYFSTFHQKKHIGGEQVRSVYEGFKADRYMEPIDPKSDRYQLVMDSTESLFDVDMAEQPAQLAKEDGTPAKKWVNVKTTLGDISSQELHYVKVPGNHVVIDFDLEGTNGLKALDRNLEAASLWPPTYAELSKSGSGVHLHYQYHGNTDDLSPLYADGIEVKVYKGDASLRRKLTRCNELPVAVISTGLPLKEKKEKMHKSKTIKTERGLRELIGRNLRKEIHPGTKPSVDFIAKIIEEAHEGGLEFDLTDLRPKVLAFANNSTHQAKDALKTVQGIKWSSVEEVEVPSTPDAEVKHSDDRIAFYDVEVYPNLFIICWKFEGDDKVVKMVNPKPHEVEQLFSLKLVGFYNRRYDNHIIYAAAMGTPIPQLFKLSMKLVEGNRGASFGAAYNLSYADIWDFASEKKSLKKWEVDLGILHMELDIPWDEPVPEDKWDQVLEYCANDVRATEAVFNNRKGDFVARQILAELSGLTVNDSTQNHTAKIIFGDDKKPQSKFVYTDLSEQFPGYEFKLGKSSYRDEDPGEGGYVYAEPGMYENVALLDVVSMHPRSIEIMNLFGPYTQAFSDLINARVAIKQGDFTTARKMLDGRLAQFLVPKNDMGDVEGADQLAYALKIVVNTVYGLTSAKFDNPFRDIRNIDNIVAKRGALFMIDLKHEIQKAGYQVCHIKTDSVKIPNADPRIIAKIMAIGQQYGYTFEHEETYEKFCLVNDAVYVAGKKPVPWEEGFPELEWKAVGAQFQHSYVFKTLFSGEPLGFADYCEARSVVKGAMYLDFDLAEEPDHTKMRHVGRTGLFVPVKTGGAKLYRVNDGKYYAVANTKGHLWMESHMAENLGDALFDEDIIDMTYFEKLKETAVETIAQFGSFDNFVKPKED
jgi:hypothetical protein